MDPVGWVSTHPRFCISGVLALQSPVWLNTSAHFQRLSSRYPPMQERFKGKRMLIKQADDQSSNLQHLEQLAAGSGAEAKRALQELRIRKAGLKGEAESAYLIDFEYAKSPNWAVIHDLRLEHDGRVAQIDHLLINRWMDIYVLESKHFHAGCKITEEGEFLRWNDYSRKFEGMASPLEQNDRHITVLRDVIEQIELPMRLGVRITPSFFPLILVAPTARIDRPRRFDSSRVIKADQLRKKIGKDIDEENALVGLLKTAAKIVSRETVEFVARQLVARHVPLVRHMRPKPPEAAPATHARSTPPSKRVGPVSAAPKPANTPKPLPTHGSPTGKVESPAPRCKQCSKGQGDILYGKFGYYFKCKDCGGNTAIRFTCQPGHNPRLRKDRNAFYRDCAECNTSLLFHRNGTDAG